MFAFHEKILKKVKGLFKQQISRSIIQSNDIEHTSHLFLKNKYITFLQKNVLNFIYSNSIKISLDS